MSTRVGDRAVVLGGSIAGTLAARVLSGFYREVVVVDRDGLAASGDRPRRGVPHGVQAHGLHARGCQALLRWFPDLLDDMRLADMPVGDLGEQRWYFHARPFRPARTGLMSLTAPRPVLEHYLRTAVAALPNVTYRELTDACGLMATPDRTRVTGVRLRSAAGPDVDPATELGADLVVDATGRGSRTPVWLHDLGYQRPTEQRQSIGLAYTTRLYRIGPGMLDGTQFVNSLATPECPRGAFFGRAGRDTCIVSLTGMVGDHAPTDPDGFLAFARSLPVPDVHQQIHGAEPLGDPVAFTFPASVRRHYERLRRMPERLVVLGDAVCSLNPNYSQGMTVAALEAAALHRHLRRGVPDSRAVMRHIARIVAVPWYLSTSRDLAFPQVPGRRTAVVRAGNAYATRLHHAATEDPRATEALLRVAGLVDRPTAFLRPNVVAAALTCRPTTSPPVPRQPSPARPREEPAGSHAPGK
ncbi:FAD-binding monooxygenase [Streptomycetaceae bacterium NBC_01309]